MKRLDLSTVLLSVLVLFVVGWIVAAWPTRGPADPSFMILDATGAVLVSEDDIDWYDWSGHQIHLRDESRSAVQGRVLQAGSRSKFFVVRAEGVECYRGSLHSIARLVDSSQPVLGSPYILFDVPDDFRDSAAFSLNINQDLMSEDARVDGQVQSRLRDVGKLRE